MVFRSWPLWPQKATLLFLNRYVVDAGFPALHETVVVKLSLLVAVAAIPLAGIVVTFILKAHGDAALVVRP
jgi:hypothetical protein